MKTALSLAFFLAWRNLWRHPKRSLINWFSLALTTGLLMFVLAFQMGTYQGMKEKSLGLLEGYAQILTKEGLEKPSLRQAFPLTPHFEQRLNDFADAHAIQWFARVSLPLLVSVDEETQPAQLIAIDPNKEGILTSAKLKAGQPLTPDSQGLWVGQGLAKRLQLELGDLLAFFAQDAQGGLVIENRPVVGLLSTGMDAVDNHLLVMPLSAFQAAFSMKNKVTSLHWMADSMTPIESLNVQALDAALGLTEKGLDWFDWKALQPGLAQAIAVDLVSGMIWYVLLILLVWLILLNSLSMSLLERREEFGRMLALGLSIKRLTAWMQLESLMTLMIGLLLGALFGAALIGYFHQAGIVIPGTESLFEAYSMPSRLYPVWHPLALSLAPAAFLIGQLAFALMIHQSFRRLRCGS